MGIYQKLKGLFKSDNSLSLIGNLVFAFFGFSSIFFLARSYSEGIFGEWVIYLSGMSFIEMIRSGITSTPMVRFIAGSKDHDERKKVIGASWFLSVLITIAIIALFVPIYYIFRDAIDMKGFGLFFRWYPLLAIVILPLNTGLSILQADRRFGAILNLRFVNMFFFFCFLVANYFWLNWDVVYVVSSLL